MFKKIKNKHMHSNNFIKNSKKICTVFIVFLLVSTVATSVTSAFSLNRNFHKNDNSIIESTENIIKEKVTTIKEKTKEIYNKISDNVDKLNTQTNDKSSIINRLSKTSIGTYIKSSIGFLSDDSSLMFYTNYSGMEKRTQLKLFRTIKIDVNNDEKNDISIKCRIFPSIERPLTLSIRFTLTITRLTDFPDINAEFEAFAEICRPGLLNEQWKGDYIRFGYNSPEGEEIPSDCIVYYKYIPYILRKDKPIHKASIDPGSSIGKADLNLLFSYIDMNNESFDSSYSLRVLYEPAIESEFSFGRNGDKSIDIKREHKGSSKVTAFLEKQIKNNKTIVYTINPPKHVTFTLDVDRNGIIEFDSHGESAEEIGVCDNYKQPVNRIFFTNLFTKAGISWNRDRFIFLTKGKADIKIYSEGTGVSINAFLVGPNNGEFEFNANSNSPINCSAELDLSEGHFILTKTNVDLSMNLNLTTGNGSIVRGSLNIKRFIEEPFVINFKDLFGGDGDANVSLSGKNLNISDVDFFVHTSQVGNVSIKMDALVKERKGCVKSSFSLQRNNGNISGQYRLDVINGVRIYNLTVDFNGFKRHKDIIDILGNKTLWFNFSINGSVIYDFASDFSWGYIKIFGGTFFNINTVFERNGKHGGVKGSVCLKTITDGFNISWKTINDTKVFSIDGGSLVSLSNFHLWFGDIVDLNIPSFNGKIILEDASPDKGKLLLEIDGSGSSARFMDLSFSSTNFLNPEKYDMVLNISMENISLQTHLYASVIAEWDNNNITDLKFEVGAEINLNMDKFIIDFKLGNNSFNFYSDSFNLSGGISFGFDLSEPEGLTLNGPLYITMTNADIFLHIVDLNLSSLMDDLDLNDITLDAETVGTAIISFEKIVITTIDEVNGIDVKEMWNTTSYMVNVTFGVNTNNGDLKINLFKIGNIGPFLGLVFGMGAEGFPFTTSLAIKNLLFEEGYCNLTIPILFVFLPLPAGFGLRIDNYGEKILTVEEIEVSFPELTLENISNMIGIDPAELPPELEDFLDSKLSAIFEDIIMRKGTFDIYIEMFLGWAGGRNAVKLRSVDGSAIDNIDLIIGFPDIASVVLSLEESFEFFNLDINFGINGESDWVNDTASYQTSYVLIDTHNKSIALDLELWIESDFIDVMSELVGNETGVFLPKVKSDIGILFENVTFQADALRIVNYIDFIDGSNNVSWMEGYLYVEAGQIWLYMNNSWQQIGGGIISFLLEPGHALIYIDEQITLPEYTIVAEDGTIITIGGTFIVNDSGILEIFWDEEGNVTIRSDVDVTLQDFILIVGDLFSISVSILTVRMELNIGLTDAISIINKEEGNVWLEIDASIDYIFVEDFAFSFKYNTTSDIEAEGEKAEQVDREPIPQNITMKISGGFDLTFTTDFYIVTNLEDVHSIQLTTLLLKVNNFDFHVYREGRETFILSWSEFEVKGYGMISFIDGNIEVAATIQMIKFVDGYLKNLNVPIGGPPVYSITFTGNFDLSGAGNIYFLQNEDGQTWDIELAGSIKISNFEILVSLEYCPLKITGGYISLTGGGTVNINSEGISAVAGINSIGASGVHINVPRSNISGWLPIDGSDPEDPFVKKTGMQFFDVKLDMDLDASGALFIKYFDNGCVNALSISGGGSITVSNFDLTIIPKAVINDKVAEDLGYIQVKFNYFYAEAVGSFATQTFRMMVDNEGNEIPGQATFKRFYVSFSHLDLNGLELYAHNYSQVLEADIYLYGSADSSAYIAGGNNVNGEYLAIGGTIDGYLELSCHINNKEDINSEGFLLNIDSLYLGGQGAFEILKIDNNLKFGVAYGNINFEVVEIVLDYDVSGKSLFIDLPTANINIQGGGYVNIIDSSQENFTITGTAGALFEITNLEISFSTAQIGLTTLIVDSLYAGGKLSAYFDRSRNYFSAIGEVNAGWSKVELNGPGGYSIVVNNFELVSGEATILLYEVAGTTTLSGSGGITTQADDDPEIYTEQELFVDLNCSVISWTDIILKGPNGKSITFPSLTVLDIDLEFTVTGRISTETDNSILNLHFNSGKPQTITINGIGAFIAECVDSWFFDNWNIQGISFEMSSGSLDLKIRQYVTSEYPTIFELGIQSTCQATLTWLEAEHNRGIITSIKIADFEIDEGSISWESSNDGEGKGFIYVSTSESMQPTASAFEIGLGAFTISLSSITLSSPGFTAEWDITSSDSFPYSTGSLYLDGGIEWSGYVCWGLIRFSDSLVADDFYIEWSDFNNTEKLLEMVNWTGILDIGIIELLILSSWIILWPTATNNQAPVAIFNYEADINDYKTITFDASDSYDPDGEITGYKWDLNNDGLWDTALYQTNPIITKTFASEGTYTVRLKVKDNGGIEKTDICEKEINVIDSNLDISIIFDGGAIYEGDFFKVNVMQDDSPVSGATVNYIAYLPDGAEYESDPPLTTDGSGTTPSFEACEVPSDYYQKYADAKIMVDIEDDGNIDGEKFFKIYDKMSDVHGHVYIAGYTPKQGIGGALVEIFGYSDEGQYYENEFTTWDSGAQIGWYKFYDVPAGTYDLRASAIGFQENTIQITVSDGDYINQDIYLEFDTPPDNQPPVLVLKEVTPDPGYIGEHIIANLEGSKDIDGDDIEWRWIYHPPDDADPNDPDLNWGSWNPGFHLYPWSKFDSIGTHYEFVQLRDQWDAKSDPIAIAYHVDDFNYLDIKGPDDEIYPNQNFNIYVTYENTDRPAPLAIVTYQYRSFGIWYNVNDQTNPKYTDNGGKVTFEAIDPLIFSKDCRVKVEFYDYITYSETFEVINEDVPELSINPEYVTKSVTTNSMFLQFLTAQGGDGTYSWRTGAQDWGCTLTSSGSSAQLGFSGNEYDPGFYSVYVYVESAGAEKMCLFSVTVNEACCFPAGTQISMADKSICKNIENIVVGDKVLSYDIENQKTICSSVTQKIIKIREGVYDINDGLISPTDDHPLYICKADGRIGWAAINPDKSKIMYNGRDAMPLEIGDEILNSDGKWIKITSIEYRPGPIETFTFIVDSNAHNYFANDFLVSNSPECG